MEHNTTQATSKNSDKNSVDISIFCTKLDLPIFKDLIAVAQVYICNAFGLWTVSSDQSG